MVWTGSKEALIEFSGYLNTIHNTIKFTMETEFTTVHFLDTRITNSGKSWTIDLYSKPTDANSLLCAKSFHPRNTIVGLQ